MPRATVEEEQTYALPEDTAFPARLNAVTVRTVEYDKKDGHGNKTGERGSFEKWKWEFEITEGEYAPLKAWGETEAKVTAGDDDVPRAWGGVLRNKTYQFGEDFDTDDLVGLPCIITVQHDPPRPRKNGGFFYDCPVEQVFPADAFGPAVGQNSDEPPF